MPSAWVQAEQVLIEESADQELVRTPPMCQGKFNVVMMQLLQLHTPLLNAFPFLVAQNQFREDMMHLELMRDAATAFPTVERKNEVRSLRIWYCKYKSLSAVRDLGNLEELVIASFPDRALEILQPLRKLRYLSIVHLPKVSDLAALSTLTNVESLSLATSPAWDATGKCAIVKSLEPIVQMKSLKHLELLGVCPEDRSLGVLQQCENLRTARFSQYPKDEVEKFYRDTGVINKFNPEPSFDTSR